MSATLWAPLWTSIMTHFRLYFSRASAKTRAKCWAQTASKHTFYFASWRCSNAKCKEPTPVTASFLTLKFSLPPCVVFWFTVQSKRKRWELHLNEAARVLLREARQVTLPTCLVTCRHYLHTVIHKLTVWVHWPPVRAPPDWEIWTAERSAVAECRLTEGTMTERHRQFKNKFTACHRQISFCNEWKEKCGDKAPRNPGIQTFAGTVRKMNCLYIPLF